MHDLSGYGDRRSPSSHASNGSATYNEEPEERLETNEKQMQEALERAEKDERGTEYRGSESVENSVEEMLRSYREGEE